MRTWIDISLEEEIFLKRKTNKNNIREALKEYLVECIHDDKKRITLSVSEIKDELISSLTLDDELRKHYLITTMMKYINERNLYKKLAGEDHVEN